MSVDAWIDQGVLHITVSGRFDFATHNEFRKASTLAENDIRQIVIDLSGTEYLDSSALGMLLVLRDKVAGDREAVRIQNARNDVKKILEIANFDKLFTMS